MSINHVLHNALSGLQTSQAGLQTTSNNISNVNTIGYARRVAEQQAATIGGQSAGVEVAEIRRMVDSFYQLRFLASESDQAQYELESRIQTRLQSLFGRPDENTSIASRLNEAVGSLNDLMIDPSSAVRRSAFLATLQDMASGFSNLSTEIQTIRADVDLEVAGKIEAVNMLIERIHTLNPQIQKQSLQGEDSTGLLDQRDMALAELAELIDIKTFPQDNGGMHVTTTDGLSLVGVTRVELQYVNPASIGAGTAFQSITAHRIDPSTGLAAATGAAIDGHINGGELRGLLNMRDGELVDLAQQVGELAAQVTDQFNAIHNDNASVPAPTTLLGRNTGMISGDALGFTGGAAVAVTATDGTLVSRIDVDFDAGTLSVDGGGAVAIGATIGSFVTALNTALGANGSASFANGVLEITAASGANGVAVLQDPAVPSDRGGRGLSHFFGLNDVLQAVEPSHFDTGLASADAHGFTAGETMDMEVRNARGELIASVTYTVGGATIGDILSSLNAATGVGNYFTMALDADGAMTATPGSGYNGYTLDVVGDDTLRVGSDVGLSQLFGLGKGPQMDQASNLGIVSRITTDPSLLSLAKLDLSATTVAGDLVLTQSDNRGAAALQALSNLTVNFDAAGGKGATVSTLGNYAASMLADAGNRAALAEARSMDSTTLRNEIDSRRQEIQGVSLDEEMSNMMVYQQAYNAAARMMAAAQQMYDTLLQLV